LIKEICYPGEKCIQTNAMKWGCDHEKDALQKFMEEIGPLHENSRLQNSGFVISQDVPFIGALEYLFVTAVDRHALRLSAYSMLATKILMRTLLTAYREEIPSLNSNLNTIINIKSKHNLVFQNMKSDTLLCGQQMTCMLKLSCSTLNCGRRFVPAQKTSCMLQFFQNLLENFTLGCQQQIQSEYFSL